MNTSQRGESIQKVKEAKEVSIKLRKQLTEALTKVAKAEENEQWLEDQDYPEMHVIEVDDDLMIKTCDMNDYRYTVITENDIVIPPLKHDDFI